jgi:hypothetical protein
MTFWEDLMSYTELKVFDKNGDAIGYKKFKNSRYVTVIWMRIAEKYGISKEGYGYEVIAKDDKAKELCELYYCDDDIELNDWYALTSTFDNVVIPPESIECVADALEEFFVSRGYVEHGHELAGAMREALKTVEGCRGLAFYISSINSDPWRVREGCIECCDPDYRPYNLDLDEKHWFMAKSPKEAKNSSRG